MPIKQSKEIFELVNDMIKKEIRLSVNTHKSITEYNSEMKNQ